jgi:hypothetical protein
MAKKKTESIKTQPASASVFEGLLFVAVAGTILAIAFLLLALSRYDWALPN